MRLRKFLIGRYVVNSVAPYFALAFLILTATILAQQSGRFTEELSAARAPLALSLEVALGVVPGIILFSLPMAVLMGTATGFARMGSDSELVALQAAGLSRRKLAMPLLVAGVLLSGVTFYDAFWVAPASSREMRQLLLDAAAERLESPVQPGVFNTQMPGKVIYIRDGDEERGEWGRVFIHWADPGGDLRLVTARTGRLDTSGDQTELVLNDALVTTIQSEGHLSDSGVRKVLTERSEQFRLRLNNGRAALLNQVGRAVDYEEMGWGSLLKSSREGSESQRRTARYSLHKRLALAITPLPFVLLGIGLGARAKRGGRASGASYALVCMVFYYLLLLGGDYLVRAGLSSPVVGAWLASTAAGIIGLILISLNRERGLRFGFTFRGRGSAATQRGVGGTEPRRNRLSLLGLLDRSVLTSLIANFVLSLSSLVAVFLIFTFFEMLRFVAANGSQAKLIPPYLFYLIPFALTGTVPIATLLTVLITYALMARRSEAVSWWASGQSLYRLSLPSLSFALCVCGAVWLIQEKVLPAANVRQEALRIRIRGGVVSADAPAGFHWLAASEQELYSYKFGEDGRVLNEPVVYRFDGEGVHLTELVRGEIARQSPGGGITIERARRLADLDRPAQGVKATTTPSLTNDNVPFAEFKPQLKPPTDYDTYTLSMFLISLGGRDRTSQQFLSFAVTFWRRQVEPLSPLIMWLNALPLALAFGRKSAVRPLMFAVVIGLTYWLGMSLFAQLGMHGLIQPFVAVSVAPLFFMLLGVYFFSRART
ncbi:MAG: LptF/LptG family permease [Pyrinomonadaceae bacterium]